MRPHIPEPPDPGARPQNRSLRPAARARRAPLVALAGALLLPLLSPIAPAAPSLPPELDPLVRNLDPGVRPGDDFFLYANGSWLRTHPIPASEQSWGIAKEVQEELYGQLRAICEAAAARTDAPRGSLEQKIGDFWAAGMDSTAIEQAGIEPLRPELDRIAAVRTVGDLLEASAALRIAGARTIFSFWVGQDDKASDTHVVFLWQGGLGLPDRDYYFPADSTTARIRAEYPLHVAAMFRLLGEDGDRAERASQSVLEIETSLARASRRLEDLRDPYANYHKMALAGLGSIAPAIDWQRHFASLGAPSLDSVVVGQPEFLAAVDSTLRAVPLEGWKDYLRWSLVNSFADRLGSAFVQQDFAFYGSLMGGAREQRPRWKRVLDAEEDGIGELLGQIWVRDHCSPATKARYEKLVEDIFAAYRDRIGRLDWMSAPTKEKALAKLARVSRKVGYPDRWRDFSALQLDRQSYARNQIRVNAWWFRHRVGKLGQPVDRTEWEMTPQTYNAYYSPSNVEIVLPAAAFLIPGTPDSLLDDAILYAYAGASTIGHEITHGFDDEGRQYDADGNLRPWWTPEDSTRFAERADLLVPQFDAYRVGDRNVRGLATLGENIADLGGVVIAYEAFRQTEQWKQGTVVNGLTPDQRFFLGYALAWLGHDRPEALAQRIMTDVHSPRFLRVNGPLANLPEFHAAFGVRSGDPMYREERQRVRIW